VEKNLFNCYSMYIGKRIEKDKGKQEDCMSLHGIETRRMFPDVFIDVDSLLY
jgi:hypothetical protein